MPGTWPRSSSEAFASFSLTPDRNTTQANTDIYYHRDTNHRNDLFLGMHVMRMNKELCDVMLRAQNVSVSAHKIVLAASSQYFHAMFTSEMLERQAHDVTLHDVDPFALELLIEYCYTAEVMITESNVQSLLPASSLLQMASVRDACCKFLLKQLHPTNCLGIRHFADLHCCSELLRMSHQFTLSNFAEVCETEEFLSLDFKDIFALVGSQELNVTSEEQVFMRVLRWLKCDVTGRKEYVGRLMRCMKLPLLTRDYLMKYVESEALVRECPETKDLLIEALKYHLMPEQRGSLQTERTIPRQSEETRPTLFVIGGSCLFAIQSENECYDPSTDQWKPFTPMISRRSRSGVIEVNGVIYVIGGYDGALDHSTAESYNPRSDKWAKIAPMGTKRSGLGVCSWNGLIYAIGGYDGASCLNSAERFDPLTSSWTSVAAMTFRRRYLKVAVLDEYIYAIGGYDGASHLSSVEKFDPQTNKWTTAPSMACRRSNPGVDVLDGHLYVTGGNDGASSLNTVERFNTKKNIWEGCAAMHTKRSTHETVAMDGYLYSIGGYDGTSSLNSVERYNPNTNKWMMIAAMAVRRSAVGATYAEVVKPKSGNFSWQNTS